MKFRRGDTLIEVLFAFVILATITGFAFTGALQAYKAAIAAQNHTQGTLLAQYEADGLKTYRDSINWEHVGLVDFSPTFLDGGGGLSGTPLPDVETDYIDTGAPFCMILTPRSGSLPVWEISGDIAGACATHMQTVAPNLRDPRAEITVEGSGSPITSVIATVTVSWTAQNSTRRDSVVNTIILTKER
jgi:hypothetical protein